MTYIKDLENRKMTNFSDTITKYPSKETLIYIHIGGENNDDLEEALDCLFFDERRLFQIVDIKRQPHLVSALVVMSGKQVEPIKF